MALLTNGIDIYRPRSVKWLGLSSINAWLVKTYSIAHQRTRPNEAVVNAALAVAATALPADPLANGAHGVGMLIVHEGLHANYALISWWYGGDMLEHRVHAAPLAAPTAFEHRPGLLACVWEMAVYAHERDAWVRHVMAAPGERSFERYLGDVLQGRV